LGEALIDGGVKCSLIADVWWLLDLPTEGVRAVGIVIAEDVIR
jgi:hypothetical protein